MIIECIELNWFRKYMKDVRSSHFYTEMSKTNLSLYRWCSILMKSWSLHNSTKKGFLISFTVTLRPLMKYYSPPCFPSRNITKSAETHPPSICDAIIEQPLSETVRIPKSYMCVIYLKFKNICNIRVWNRIYKSDNT